MTLNSQISYRTPRVCLITIAGPKRPFYLRLDFTEDQFLSKIEAFSPEGAPRTKWQYSNTNYVLLDILIVKITGMPYANLLHQKIFGPGHKIHTRNQPARHHPQPIVTPG